MKLQVLAAILVTILTYAVSLLCIFQRNLIYPAPQELRETPAARGLAYEEVNLDTGNGETTHGWFIPAENAKGVVLYSHGNGDNVGSSIDEAEFMHKLGYSVMLYDYGGYGMSSGHPTEQRNYADGRAAWKYLTETRGIPGDHIILWGISLGGGISCQLALEVNAAALVLEGTFTSIPGIAHSRCPILDFDNIVLDKYENIEKIPNVEEPVLLYHSKNDGTVPFSLGEELFSASKEPHKLVELQGGHAKGIRDDAEVYTAAWTEFVDPILDGKAY